MFRFVPVRIVRAVKSRIVWTAISNVTISKAEIAYGRRMFLTLAVTAALPKQPDKQRSGLT